jgi:hypothetical protein
MMPLVIQRRSVFTLFGSELIILCNNTCQGYVRKRILKLAGYFFVVHVLSARICKAVFTITFVTPKIRTNIPVMPLTEAHFDGFFVFGAVQ